MNKLTIWAFLILLVSCSPIKLQQSNAYKLDAYSSKQFTSQASKQSILITVPEAVAGYQTEDMLYMKKPFELSSFTKNVWVDPPAEMLLPLIAQSLQRSGYFNAVTSTTNSELTDYRLDTQLMELQQNFITTPSHIDLVVKVVLSHVSDNRVVASRLFSQRVKCPADTPYGGVTAANIATKNFTAEATAFVVSQARQDSSRN
ncbi:transport protein [Legionella nautarum]|uniref:Transport protein n=1 Tax=Legionella nautarum TaxID=45070 RepID=A0A0W0WM54_9GAMM|nr:ABC-type transport auxiliary lipoprotein family protein [Legionella nautarum]KTD33402.1 transport protein [Legionella nautarum]